MMRLSKEFWVGSFVLLVLVLMAIFGSLMGVFSPFSRDATFPVMYNFAGGVEVGSAVRVSGVKVGKVESIEFLPVEAGSEMPALRIVVSIARRALSTVRKDSKFYINMAGIIGERYVEITPGHGELLPPGTAVRGVDPPRIDQLLSQGYSVFGRIQQFLDEKEQTISEFIDQLSILLTDANDFLKGKENRRAIFALIGNLNALSGDLRRVLTDEESKKFFKRLGELMKRAEKVDKQALKQFLQEEGIRARIF